MRASEAAAPGDLLGVGLPLLDLAPAVRELVGLAELVSVEDTVSAEHTAAPSEDPGQGLVE